MARPIIDAGMAAIAPADRAGRQAMSQPPPDLAMQARRKGAVRTAWILGALALAIFLLSFLQMVR
jgi:hypothetical protein